MAERFPVDDIKAISFDLDGTLWDFEAVMRKSIGVALEEIRKHDADAADQLTVDRIIGIRDRVAQELKAQVIDLEKIRLESFRRTLIEVGRPDDDLAQHVFEVYITARFAGMELYDDVEPTIKALRTKFTVGALSNGNSYPDRVGMAHLFDFAAMAQRLGVAKPDPRIFHTAAEMAGCEPHELLHVGDDIEDDIHGALDAGVRAIWINRNGSNHVPPTEVEGSIDELDQLVEMLLNDAIY